MDIFIEMFHFGILQKTLIVIFFASIVCGVIGTYVLIKRLVFLSGGLAHISLGGIAVAHSFKINPFWGAFFFNLIASFILGFARSKGKNEDTVMGILWPLSMCLGVIFLSLFSRQGQFFSPYLWGNIFFVSLADIWNMFIIVCFIVSIVVIFFSHFQSVCFDEEFAQICGLNTRFFYTLLLILIALAVFILIKVVGLILLISLMTIPSAISQKFVFSVKKMMLLGSVLTFIFMTTGLLLSYFLDCSASATIVLLSCLVYIFFNLFY